MQENTVFPLSEYWSTWWTKGNNTESMPLDSTPVRDEQGSLVTENGGHSLLPSPHPPSPTPRLRLGHWHIHAGGPERSVEITVQHYEKHGLRRGKPSRPMIETEEKHREGNTGKSSEFRSSHLFLFGDFFSPLSSILASPPIWILLSWNN